MFVYTPSLRIQTAPELEDAGNLVHTYMNYMRFKRGFIICDDKDDGHPDHFFKLPLLSGT